MKKTALLLTACSVFALALAGCGDKKADQAPVAAKEVTITVGATPVPHADILKVAAPELKKQGVNLKVIEFTDYVKPNLALADKEIDANYFQHVPYLESFAKDRKLNLSVLCSVHIEPMAVYSKTIKDLKSVPDGAKVAIPNDPTNGGRALKVLSDAGLPRALDDVTLAVINSNYALGVGLNPAKDSLFIESADSPYANVVVIRTGDNREALSKLAQVMHSQVVRDYILKQYKGAVHPTF